MKPTNVDALSALVADIDQLTVSLEKEKAELNEMEDRISKQMNEDQGILSTLKTRLQKLNSESKECDKRLLEAQKQQTIPPEKCDHFVHWLTIKAYLMNVNSFRSEVEAFTNRMEILNQLASSDPTKNPNNNSNLQMEKGFDWWLPNLVSAHEHLCNMLSIEAKVSGLKAQSADSSESNSLGIFPRLQRAVPIECRNATRDYEKVFASLVNSELIPRLGWPMSIPSYSVLRQSQPAWSGESVLSVIEKLVSLSLDYTSKRSGSGVKMWFLELLLAPVQVRFRYHFEGKRETNRLDKPEWFLAYVQKCLGIMVPFTRDYLAPLYSRLRTERDVIEEPVGFVIGRTVDFVRARMQNVCFVPLLDKIANSSSANDNINSKTASSASLNGSSKSVVEVASALLSHAVLEMVEFDRMLQNKFGCLGSTYQSMRFIYESDEYFEAWFSVEKKFTDARLEELIEDSDRWRRHNERDQKIGDEEDSEDELKSGNKASRFTVSLQQLLEAVKDRFKHLSDSKRRLQFALGLIRPALTRALFFLESFKEGTLYHQQHGKKGINTELKLEQTCALANFCYLMILFLSHWEDDLVFVELFEFMMEEVKSSSRQISSPSSNNHSMTSLFSGEINHFKDNLNKILSEDLISLSLFGVATASGSAEKSLVDSTSGFFTSTLVYGTRSSSDSFPILQTLIQDYCKSSSAPVLDPSPALCRILLQVENIERIVSRNLLSPLFHGRGGNGTLLNLIRNEFLPLFLDRLDELFLLEFKRYARCPDLGEALQWQTDLSHLFQSVRRRDQTHRNQFTNSISFFPRCREMISLLVLPESSFAATLEKLNLTTSGNQPVNAATFSAREKKAQVYLREQLSIYNLSVKQCIEIMSKRRK